MVAAQELPKDHAILQCEICRSSIGIFKPDELATPINASMFKSIDEFHKFPPPFQVEKDGRGNYLGWQNFFCPYCRNIPFEDRTKSPEQIKTPYGFVKIGDTRVPRPRSIADDNQEKLEQEWEREKDSHLTPEERNQKVIDAFPSIPEGNTEELKPIILPLNYGTPDGGPPKDETDFKDPNHTESHVTTAEEAKAIKDVKPQSDRTGDFKADKAILKGRCKFCGKQYKRADWKNKHQRKCKDNPKNQKKKNK